MPMISGIMPEVDADVSIADETGRILFHDKAYGACPVGAIGSPKMPVTGNGGNLLLRPHLPAISPARHPAASPLLGNVRTNQSNESAFRIHKPIHGIASGAELSKQLAGHDHALDLVGALPRASG
jgi:hypothetical protein